MYLSIKQIGDSLQKLQTLNPFFGMSLLAFKKAKIPVGRMKDVVFSRFADEILEDHYRPTDSYEGYYNPFQTSKKTGRWVQPRYSETSLQRITSNTFGDAILHPKAESQWGWVQNYVSILQDHLGKRRIPAFDLAVWLYRQEKWPADVTASTIENHLFSSYEFSAVEVDGLFERALVGPVPDLATDPVSERDLLDLLGPPPGSKPDEGAALEFLEVTAVGPARHLLYSPSERLNVITGDNSLGKTFILECIWWALTGRWISHSALQRRNVPKKVPELRFGIAAPGKKMQIFGVGYDWERFRWSRLPTRSAHAGLVIYGRYDGSFGVWDPVRSGLLDTENDGRPRGHLRFTRQQIWNGLKLSRDPRSEKWACNGLLRDWVTWQSSTDKYKEYFDRLTACLEVLSPPRNELLKPGPPIRLPLDAREIPTLQMPYERVPVIHASAGVQRILALAYVLVWAWQEHLAMCESVRRAPQRRVVMIIDEVEAHLHPKWQRVIVPALIRVIRELSKDVTTQLHIATHSPMVLASIEPEFSAKQDQLHHLRLVEKDVVLEEPSFVKRGTADNWLMSEIFDMETPRSLPAEDAIRRAKELQLTPHPATDAIRAMHERLVGVLAPDDEFWPRWRHFAISHGVQN